MLGSETRLAAVPTGGPVAFALTIDNTGLVTVAQYLSLQHPDATNPDDPLVLSGQIAAQVTVTDGDGDVSTIVVGIGAAIIFKDDGPTSLAARPGRSTRRWLNEYRTWHRLRQRRGTRRRLPAATIAALFCERRVFWCRRRWPVSYKLQRGYNVADRLWLTGQAGAADRDSAQ